MSCEMTMLINEINSEFIKIAERILLPHFQKIQIIENILKEMPAFKNLENENKFLKQQLSSFKVVNEPEGALSNQELLNELQVVPTIKQAPVQQAPVVTEPIIIAEPVTLLVEGDAIKLEIVESETKLAVSEMEIYQDINLKLKVSNIIIIFGIFISFYDGGFIENKIISQLS